VIKDDKTISSISHAPGTSFYLSYAMTIIRGQLVAAVTQCVLAKIGRPVNICSALTNWEASVSGEGLRILLMKEYETRNRGQGDGQRYDVEERLSKIV
jgi:hypothetical protein